jgi:hypothetical protein
MLAVMLSVTLIAARARNKVNNEYIEEIIPYPANLEYMVSS